MLTLFLHGSCQDGKSGKTGESSVESATIRACSATGMRGFPRFQDRRNSAQHAATDRQATRDCQAGITSSSDHLAMTETVMTTGAARDSAWISADRVEVHASAATDRMQKAAQAMAGKSDVPCLFSMVITVHDTCLFPMSVILSAKIEKHVNRKRRNACPSSTPSR